MKKWILILLTLLVLCTTCFACGKKETETDPNAVLTDSDLPLDVGAEMDLSVIDGHAEN